MSAYLLQGGALIGIFYAITALEKRAVLRGQKGDDRLGPLYGRIMRICFLFVFTLPLLYILPVYVYAPLFIAYGFSFSSLKELCFSEKDVDHEVPDGKLLRWIRPIGKYFNVRLVKTVDLPASGTYIIAVHPHGILPFGSVISIATNYCGIRDMFPGLRYNVLTASMCYMIPLYRELVLHLGGRDAGRYVAKRILKSGRSVVVVPGGAAEALYNDPSVDIVYLKKRHGFVRLAIESGASLVPIFTFNECNTFKVISPTMSTAKAVQKKFQMVLGMSVPFITSLMPKRTSLTTVVGAPLHVTQNSNPTPEETEKVLQEYIRRLEELYREHGPTYNMPASKQLEII